MPDRRQQECSTPQEIAATKIEGVQVREGEDRDAVLRAMLDQLQERFGADVQEVTVKHDEATTQDSGPEQELLDERPKTLVAVHVADDGKERGLTPEVQAALLGRLKQRFEANMNRHEGVNWADVLRALEADPAKLWSLQEMEKSGHAPDVYMEDDGAYYFGTCCVETPEAHLSIVFDAAAEQWLRENRPQETCYGNAVDIAAAMGVELMDEAQYRHLQTLGHFDVRSQSWLKTLDEKREHGVAFYGYSFEGRVSVRLTHAGKYDHAKAFRGSLRVSKA